MLELSSKVESACGAVVIDGESRRWPEWFHEHVTKDKVTLLSSEGWAERFDTLLSECWNPARNELCDVLGLLPRAMGIANGYGGAVYMSSFSDNVSSLPREVSFSSCHRWGLYALLLDHESKTYAPRTDASELSEHEEAREALTSVAKTAMERRERLPWVWNLSDEDDDVFEGEW